MWLCAAGTLAFGRGGTATRLVWCTCELGDTPHEVRYAADACCAVVVTAKQVGKDLRDRTALCGGRMCIVRLADMKQVRTRQARSLPAVQLCYPSWMSS